ncbi:hypothetical protein [Burkholderia plantarii]|uniref:Holin of 3TMs, for gene-transfer release n=1 Tax=Burkholderia plantarii TaxID=41899 RepID=A0A0B6RX46_BURPL|nr:hypothetical protein [Burkholderia plantarii]AJK45630.1 hypothetical protein BGL_1c11080 [Burkholderia plantarii]ALK29882.1 hypothetical protein bpln_1g10620 [Burkholderia plantarii]WLE58630.1 hypothetical protein GIY62_16125 [Burkholderia plantarii]GLZ20801.1 hypothetical protein Bpla01_43300 [Burkholderia plantarii]
MSTWGDVAAEVSKVAPILGNAVPGVGTLVGSGVGLAASVIAKALGTDPSPDSVMGALANDPEAAGKLKQAEMDHERDLAQIAAQREQTELSARTALYAAEAADRDSARKLAATQPRDWVRPTITFGLLFGAIAILVFVFHGNATLLKDATTSLTVGTVIGYWFNELKQTLSFWFGTTSDATMTNAKVADFAVSPGAVMAPGSHAPGTTGK